MYGEGASAILSLHGDNEGGVVPACARVSLVDKLAGRAERPVPDLRSISTAFGRSRNSTSREMRIVTSLI